MKEIREHHTFDERWRWVATFRESDTSPKEEFLHHAAGFDGQGTGSYIDLVVLRNRDANTAWTSASDGTLEERLYYCQNWRADVVSLITDAGAQVEQVRYSAYGVPFGLPAGDCDSDGDCDSSDQSQHNSWTTPPGAYDVRGDLDLDGGLDSTDYGAIQSHGQVLGRSLLSSTSVNSKRGYGGRACIYSGSSYAVASSVFDGKMGRWSARDIVENTEGAEVPGGSVLHNINAYSQFGASDMVPAGPDSQGSGQGGPQGAEPLLTKCGQTQSHLMWEEGQHTMKVTGINTLDSISPIADWCYSKCMKDAWSRVKRPESYFKCPGCPVIIPFFPPGLFVGCLPWGETSGPMLSRRKGSELSRNGFNLTCRCVVGRRLIGGCSECAAFVVFPEHVGGGGAVDRAAF